MTMIVDSITSLAQASHFLKVQENNYLSQIYSFLVKLLNSRREWVDIIELKRDIDSKMSSLCDICSDWVTQISVDCVIFNYLHDLTMPLIYKKCEVEDQLHIHKAQELGNITPEQIGAPVECSITLSAAVVELASLDYHKSPLEKMWCLCTTYDLIFAELKTALINVFSKHPDRDFTIPIVNNKDIIPILVTVILQSKLTHVHSNFCYLNLFLGCLNQNEQFRHVIMMFREAITRIRKLSRRSLRPGSVALHREMDLIELIKLTSEMAQLKDQERPLTPFEGQLINVTDLIVKSTNQNQILPNM